MRSVVACRRELGGRFALLSLVAVWAFLPGPGAAADASEPVAALTTEVQVSLVQLEVRVDDKDGNFVAGLSATDFEVQEDGAPVQVLYVDEFANGREVIDREELGVASSPGPSAGEAPARPERRMDASVVVVIDGANSGPSAVARQKSYVKNFLRSLQGSPVRVGLFVLRPDGSYRLLSGFDRSLADTVQAVEDVRFGTGGESAREGKLQQMESGLEDKLSLCSVDGGVRQQLCFDSAFDRVINTARTFATEEQTRVGLSMDSLRAILGFADHLPGRRSMVLVSEGLDPGGASYFNAAAQLIQYTIQNQGVRGAERWIADAQQAAATFVSQVPEFGRIAETALASGITVHWINPSHSGGSTPFSPESSLGSYTVGGSFVNVVDPVALMRDLAEETGGVARVRAANIEGFYDRVRDDIRRFYVVSYSPRRSYHDGQSHTVEVRLKDGRGKVRTRGSYVDHEPQTRRLRALASALDFPEVYRDLATTANLSYLLNADGKYAVNLHLAIPYSQIVTKRRDDAVEGLLQLGFTVRGEDGIAAAVDSPMLRIDQAATDFRGLVQAGAYLDYRQQFQLAAGVYLITAAAIDTNSERAGTQRFRVELPEANAACLKVTPLMLAARSAVSDPPVAKLEFDARGDLLYRDRRLSFAAVRALPDSGQLAGLYQVLNAAKGPDDKPAVQLVFRLVRGQEVVSQTTPTRADAFNDSNDTVTSFFSVPYNGLAPGAYRLELVVQDEISACVAAGGADFTVMPATEATTVDTEG